MFDFIKGLFIWLVKKILFIFFPVIGWIVFFFETFSSVIKAIWDFYTSWFVWFLQDFYLWFFNKLTDYLTAFFAGNDFVVNVLEFSNNMFTAMNCFLPMNEACFCLTLVLHTVIAVFLLRILLKAIPTVW